MTRYTRKISKNGRKAYYKEHNMISKHEYYAAKAHKNETSFDELGPDYKVFVLLQTDDISDLYRLCGTNKEFRKLCDTSAVKKHIYDLIRKEYGTEEYSLRGTIEIPEKDLHLFWLGHTLELIPEDPLVYNFLMSNLQAKHFKEASPNIISEFFAQLSQKPQKFEEFIRKFPEIFKIEGISDKAISALAHGLDREEMHRLLKKYFD